MAECSIPACEDEAHARSWCDFHYNRWRKHGDPLAGAPRRARRSKEPLSSDAKLARAARAQRESRARKGVWQRPDGLCSRCVEAPVAGKSPWCKSCNAGGRRRERTKWTPEQRAERNRVENDRSLRRNHGITRAEYDALLAGQDTLCAICRRPPTSKRLAVDHDHSTGAVRALLCDWCNRSLGWVEAVGLPAVDEYLRHHP